MKIYTKTGDKGTTALYGGGRVSKAAFQIEVYGTLDELNSYIGLLRSIEVLQSQKAVLQEIQDRLFTIGSYLASDPTKKELKKPDLLSTDVDLLESEIDKMETQLEPLTKFVLPGGSLENSYVHLARVCCRKVERMTVALVEEKTALDIPALVVTYLNRLSDYLFVMSRLVTKLNGDEEFPWIPRNK